MAEGTFSGQYDWKLVALSIVIAFFAAYITLELAERSVSSPLRRKNFWVGSGALSLGTGLWGMHDLGLLAAHLPGLIFPNDLFSLLAASGCSLLACLLPCWRPAQKRYLLFASLALSACMSAMLYTAFEGLQNATRPAGVFGLVAISLAIAPVASVGAFKIGFRLRAGMSKMWMRLACGAVMALAMTGIQYVGISTMNVPVRNFPTVDIRSVLAHNHAVIRSDRAASEITIWVAAILLAVFALSVLLSEADRVLTTQRGLLRSEQERGRLVMSANQDGLFDFNMITGAVFYSPRWKEIIGYGANDLDDVLETWQHRIHPDDRKRVDAEIEEYLRGGKGTAELEYRLRHRNGSWRWILARSQAIWNENGRAVRLVGFHCDITDRKRALEDLSASEARFGAFMEHNPNIAFIKDADGKFLYTNPTQESLWKLKPGEWVGKTNAEIWPEAVAKRVDESDREVLSAHVRSEMIEEFEIADGSTHQFLTSKFSFPGVSGKRLLGGVSIDVTEHIQSQERLRVSESRYRELFEHNPLPSWIYRTRDLRILNVNQAAIEHYGWSRAQFLNLTVRSLHPPEEAQAADWELKHASGNYQQTKPMRHRRNGKSEIWVELSTQEFEVGDATCRLVLANDVSERIRAQLAVKREHGLLETLVAQRASELQASEAKWHSLVEALPQIVWSARPDGYCEYVSQQLADYTGAPVSDLVGWGWLGYVHTLDRERLRERWMTAVSTGTRYEVEYRIRSQDGGYRWFATCGRCIEASSDGQRESQWLGTTSDIEDQKRSQEELEAAVVQRTTALAQARDWAEQEVKAKNEFLASMSHDVRRAMNGVLGLTSQILEMPLNSKQRAYADAIRAGGGALLNVINEVDFSQTETAKIELERAELDLPALLEESIEVVAAQASAKGIRLSLNVAEDMPFTIIGDAGRLQRVLRNLLSNAIKFTDVGSISVSASKQAASSKLPEDSTVSDGSTIVFLSVRDTGIGLSTDEQTALFQPCEGSAPSSRGRFGGSGMGFRVAQRLVEAMGGQIGVTGERGEGSTFWFRVPVIAVSHEVTFDFQQFSARRILLLANASGPLNGYPAGMARRYLERAGLELVVSEWPPSEALDNAGEMGRSLSPISLVIGDETAVKAVFDGSASQWLPMIDRCPALILGSPAGGSNPKLALLPDAAYVPKPIRYQPLLGAVRRLLSSGVDSNGVAEERERGNLHDAEILLVENNWVARRIAKVLLDKLGCQVTVAQNGLEACAAVEYRSYDLILMDCQMPDLYCFEATRLIREKEAVPGRRTPILALGTDMSKEERERCLAAGMDGFLTKPFDQQGLEFALQNWMTERKSSAQVAG